MDADETAVSRDERNECHGITVERAKKVLDALGVRLVTRVEVEPLGVGEERAKRTKSTSAAMRGKKVERRRLA